MAEQSVEKQLQGIVVGYDGSPGSDVALSWAAATAQRWGATVTVLHCIDLATMPIGATYGLDQLPTDMAKAGQEVLAAGIEQARRVVAEPSQVIGVTAVGSPAAVLVEASKGADLVVTSSRGRGRVAAGLLGSVSYAVTAHAACPAVIVRGERPIHPDAEHPVVVGFDDSRPAERALDLAAEVAAISGAALRIVTVARLGSSPDAFAYVESAKAGTEHTHDVRAQAEEIVQRAAARARATYGKLHIDTEVLYGAPGHVLSPLGAHAGLMVVGSRGRGGFAGLVLGSVSHTVIQETACPVMVVRQ
jgi:nucleotide-binding universal stress UspA family protein